MYASTTQPSGSGFVYEQIVFVFLIFVDCAKDKTHSTSTHAAAELRDRAEN